ncbi:MAG: hypothetical protein R3Y47_06480 [Lachnospiraceae bacterium]
MKTKNTQTLNTNEIRQQMRTNGNTAYALDRQVDRSANRKVRERIANEHMVKNQVVVRRMHVPSIMFAVASFALLCMVVFSYLNMRSDIVSLSSRATSLQSSISTLSADNDEKYAGILASVNLDDIKAVAINELGMVYAKQDQIIQYEARIDDYVQQYQAIEY